MKTTKRVLAVVLTMLMLAMMIPFSASAVTDYTATIDLPEGYTASIYRIADFNGTDAYTAVSGVAANIKTAVEATPAVPADILAAAEGAKKSGQNTGAKTGEDLTAGATNKVTFTTTTPGLYYATVTGTPSGVNVKQTGGCIFYLSTAKNAQGVEMTTATGDLASKIRTDEVSVSKTIVNSDMNNYQGTAKVGEEVTFELLASIPGTKDEYLTAYTIHDSMATGVDYVKVDSVYVGTTKLTETTDYTVSADNKADIQISLTAAYLNAAKAGTNNFYNDDTTDVKVNLVGKLNTSAVVGRTANDNQTVYANTVANYNKDSLTYTNKYNDTTEKEGNTVHLYTFSLPVEKVDATTNQKIADPATFLLTGANNFSESKDTVAGEVTFTGLKAGTYTLKETVAPKGYNLNNTTFTVVISNDGTITVNGAAADKVTVPDTPVVMPATGGNGTMIFTIVGASLIACAGILFIIVRKKKSSK